MLYVALSPITGLGRRRDISSDRLRSYSVSGMSDGTSCSALFLLTVILVPERFWEHFSSLQRFRKYLCFLVGCKTMRILYY